MPNNDRQTGKPFVPLAPIVPSLKPPSGEAAQAWTAFCDRLKTAGHLLLSQPGCEDELMQAESLRYLIRELRTGLEWKTEAALYAFPRFFYGDLSGSGPPGPNIDNSYMYAHIRGGASYRVTIDTKSISGFIFTVTNRVYRNDGDYSLSDFKVGDDGILEIFVGPEPMPGNYVRSYDDAYRLSIRVYYQHWDTNSLPELHIERLGAEGEAPPIPSVALLSSGLQETVEFLETWPFKYPIFQTRYADQIEPNVMRPPLGIPGGGQEIQYGLSRYVLADDEALIVESEVPDAPYWGFHVYTMPWFSQIDPANRVTALNNTQSYVHADGKVRYVVSKKDPGIQNWLDTGGFSTGSVFYRWIWSKNSPAPTSRLVKFSELAAALPSDTPAFSKQQRCAQIAARRWHLQKRLRA